MTSEPGPEPNGSGVVGAVVGFVFFLAAVLVVRYALLGAAGLLRHI